MILKMAFRNILRHKRRTLISVVTVAVGIMFYIVMDSLFNGIDRLLVESIVKFSDSSIVVYSKEYDENRRGYPIDKGIKDYDSIEDVILSVEGVEGVVYRTQFLGEIIFGSKSKYVVGTVVNPFIDTQVFEINKHIIGNYLSNVEGEVLMGSILAKKLGIKIGDYLTISAKTVGGGYNALDFKVVGLVNSPSTTLNESGIIISYSSANKLLNLRNSKTSLHVKVNWNKGESVASYLNKLDMVSKEIKSKIGEYRVYTIKDIYGDFLLLMEQKRITSYLITFLVLVIAGVGIANGVLMSVYERVKEIGMLMAMGMKPKMVRRLFLLEGTMIGILGGFLGLVLGFVADVFMIYIGWDVSSMYRDLDPSNLGMPVWGVLYGEWNIWAFVIGFLFSFLVAIISSYIPSRYASKLKVIDCLKFV
ncbi:MAG: ABC transporter permease [Brevinematales bacterium]|nr:ABC transporter permease [Brevinematales bacterium]